VPGAWQSPASRITQPSASSPQNARNCSVGRPRGAIAPSRSQTSLPGNTPSRARQRLIPNATSENSLENTSCPQRARVGHTSPRSRGASGPSRPESQSAAHTDQTAPARRADSGCAESCAAAEQTAAATRAANRRGSSCRPQPSFSSSSRIRTPDSVGSSASSSSITATNGSSFDGRGGRGP
jgi:hypothetical protein